MDRDDDEPATINVEVPAEGEVPAPAREPDIATFDGAIHDPEFLARHRATLLASQRIAAGELAARERAPWRGDLVIASVYSLYGFPLAVWVLSQARGRHAAAFPAPIALVAFTALFGVLLWRAFARSYRAARARTYEGRFIQRRVDFSVFDGGEVALPEELQRQLVPGVRYRVHRTPTGGADDVVIDVALDDVDVAQSAYR